MQGEEEKKKAHFEGGEEPKYFITESKCCQLKIIINGLFDWEKTHKTKKRTPAPLMSKQIAVEKSELLQ